MADKDILQSVYPHIGGQENISRTIPRKNILYVMLKDAGAVDLDSVRQTEGIEAAELERGCLALHLAGQEEKENTMAQDYQKMGEAILEAVGGKENITALTHCATRLRFNLADDSKADEAKVKAVKGVMGVRNQGGQFQVIIGQDVSFPYDVIMKICKLDANKNDASASTRDVNKASIRKYIQDAPWGIGIGNGYDNVPANNKYRKLSTIPPDSEYVFIWVHTGIIGLVVFLITTMAMWLGACCIVFFRLKNRSLQGMGAALCCSFIAIQLGGYGNQILMQFPNVLIFYGGLSLVYIMPHIEAEYNIYEAKLIAEQEERKRIKLEKKRAARV